MEQIARDIAEEMMKAEWGDNPTGRTPGVMAFYLRYGHLAYESYLKVLAKQGKELRPTG